MQLSGKVSLGSIPSAHTEKKKLWGRGSERSSFGPGVLNANPADNRKECQGLGSGYVGISGNITLQYICLCRQIVEGVRNHRVKIYYDEWLKSVKTSVALGLNNLIEQSSLSCSVGFTLVEKICRVRPSAKCFPGSWLSPYTLGCLGNCMLLIKLLDFIPD